ncbi:MAG: ribosome recycling factor [Gammaproteobacteria bacterium]|nr:MAG: ribosome recycling factor [Gammaproteobacteria bacterium]
MINEITKDAEERMKKSIDSLKGNMAKIRTGRAHPSLLEHLTVSCYGSSMPINQVANVTVSDSRTLAVTPWDKSMVQPIEKAIMTADLGLNPVTAGEVIRIPLPPLTEERRKDLVKVVKNEAENGKIAVRNIRRDANNDFKSLLKDKEISEDEHRGAEDGIQKVTDKYVNMIDDILAEKEKELMSV